ncbi:MAG: formate--tetrahydrofolate ligase [Planctomycetes bacterium]|nr:formate--tetrahydrofolate ligase [Planctomycetota bacterium]
MAESTSKSKSGAKRRPEDVKPDIEIAQAAKIKPITQIAKTLGIDERYIEPYGHYKAKISLDLLDTLKNKPLGKYIVVTAITPTPLGEGKTVTTIGLSMALNHIGKNAVTCIRQPSLGPVFGIKGGAAGGGYSQVIPMEDFNLHLTGDVHAVSITHNLLAAFIDNSIYHGNKLDIDPKNIFWRRVVDISDRALRNIITGLNDEKLQRETGFDIAVASEVMAILALTADLKDLRKRLGRIVVATDKNGKPVTADDLKCAGSMAILMKDALKPNLLQTLENTPCFVHAGPFGNIAHGNNSIIADRMALRLSDYVVTESGFGADCGAEKFINIKCRVSGLKPDCAVIVASIRALKMHGGLGKIVAGKPLPEELKKENLGALEKGCANLEKHIENMLLHGVPVVVAINKFTTDTEKEIELVREIARKAGAQDALTCDVWANGGAGGTDLAMAVAKAADKPSKFRFLYETEWPIKKKIETIATKIYGAKDVHYEPLAEEKIKMYTELGYDKLPICMAKTHLSLSHDPELKGRPSGFTLPVRDVRASIGAGFLYPLCGKMMTMPGLPSNPAGAHYDITDEGKVLGLF